MDASSTADAALAHCVMSESRAKAVAFAGNLVKPRAKIVSTIQRCAHTFCAPLAGRERGGRYVDSIREAASHSGRRRRRSPGSSTAGAQTLIDPAGEPEPLRGGSEEEKEPKIEPLPPLEYFDETVDGVKKWFERHDLYISSGLSTAFQWSFNEPGDFKIPYRSLDNWHSRYFVGLWQLALGVQPDPRAERVRWPRALRRRPHRAPHQGGLERQRRRSRHRSAKTRDRARGSLPRLQRAHRQRPHPEGW